MANGFDPTENKKPITSPTVGPSIESQINNGYSPYGSTTTKAAVETGSGWWAFTIAHIKLLQYQFISDEALHECIQLVETRVYLLAAVAYAVLFIMVIEPVSCIIVESRPLRYKMQAYLYRPFEYLFEKAFYRIFNLQVFGEPHLNMNTLTVMMANHQGVIDYAVLIMLCRKAGIIDSSFFFVFKHCVRLPSLRVLYNMWRMQTNWRVPDISLASTFAPVLESPWMNEGGKSIIIFPEVMSWSATTMLEDRAECVEEGCPKLNELLYPRFNAFVQALAYLRDHPLTEIYDVTLLYSCDGQLRMPSFKQLLLLTKQKWTVQLHIRKYPISSLPRKEKHLIRWLEKEWFRKDTLISDLKMKALQT